MIEVQHSVLTARLVTLLWHSSAPGEPRRRCGRRRQVRQVYTASLYFMRYTQPFFRLKRALSLVQRHLGDATLGCIQPRRRSMSSLDL
ncbi:hypothetical protein M405DRAFT_263378 [Rhizopogon salebrosus TDB-379]|nr:hypothetical protein M405DRAFT_263378 [Rhizopogon salebrosus TDB-379]